jgi:hypothetical protein
MKEKSATVQRCNRRRRGFLGRQIAKEIVIELHEGGCYKLVTGKDVGEINTHV